MSDPLLQPDAGPLDHHGKPVRAPLGNSIKTLMVFVVLLAVVVVFLWWRRPTDQTMEIGGREWVITAFDDEPAVNRRGLVSTFVLDGVGEARGVVECNIASGPWQYESDERLLSFEWAAQTQIACADDWPVTYLPIGGSVDVGDGEMRVDDEIAEMTAIALADLESVEPDEIAGEWTSGSHAVLFGRRGLVEFDSCQGEWSAVDDAYVSIRFDEAQGDDCVLDPAWLTDDPLIPVVHGDVLYLRRDRVVFPVDREIIRLDPAE